MTHVCCPSCRLRLTRAAAARLVACPECGGAVEPLPTPQALGFRLIADDSSDAAMPNAVAVEMPVPGDRTTPS